MNPIDFQLGLLTGALAAGALCGLFPLIVGLCKNQLIPGSLGMAACIFFGLHGGVLLALPLALASSLFILSSVGTFLSEKTFWNQIQPLVMAVTAGLGYLTAQHLRRQQGLSGALHGAVFGGVGSLAGFLLLYCPILLLSWLIRKDSVARRQTMTEIASPTAEPKPIAVKLELKFGDGRRATNHYFSYRPAGTEADGNVMSGRTNEAGVAMVHIPPHATTGQLEVWIDGVKHDVAVTGNRVSLIVN